VKKERTRGELENTVSVLASNKARAKEREK